MLQWTKPEHGWVKCNVDVVFQYDSGRGATGMVLRNDRGIFLGAQATAYPFCLDALTMEAYVCRDGLILAEKLGVNRLHLKIDCHELVSLWGARMEAGQ
jgi:hypothetical protein